MDEFSWFPDSQHIIFVTGDRGEAPIYETNLSGDSLWRWGRAHGEWSEVRGPFVEGRLIVVGTLVHADRPAEIVITNPQRIDESGKTISIVSDQSGPSHVITPPPFEPIARTHLNDVLLSQLELAPLESYWFTGAEGIKVEGFIVRPPNFDPKKKYPVKFLIHGGPQGAWGDAWSYRWNPS